ncbi:transposase [Methanospirillum sp. J.3.6.1-F.2.7.3]|uniref:Transposase n=1 Tax=Methanospirillum purgamenti TaxID=2834276 RepID=A0A8E7AZT8_9EURY|nr:transposase [Methanospirillum sp. J.3.6.1-F.2.7.3]
MKGLIILPRGSNTSKFSTNVIGSGTSRDLSYFITSSPWSPENVMKLTRSHAIHLLGPGGSVIFDETGQQKYGPASVGTSFQYLGKTGHTCTAQVGVFASYCVDNLAALFDYRLFIPES